ncbi:hypothetical protein BJ741DRAFT_597219 [Chytriomyces cf. hyalinus JEL632]|nr:hypothetical protein BJ741DRAFT_597219 [Chytriomyces cf. hyalinus JEL632]
MIAYVKKKKKMKLYKILGIPATATTKQIKEAFVRISLEVHPDRQLSNASDNVRAKQTQTFMRAKEAYEVLKDRSKRADYDRRYLGTTTTTSVPPSADFSNWTSNEIRYTRTSSASNSFGQQQQHQQQTEEDEEPEFDESTFSGRVQARLHRFKRDQQHKYYTYASMAGEPQFQGSSVEPPISVAIATWAVFLAICGGCYYWYENFHADNLDKILQREKDAQAAWERRTEMPLMMKVSVDRVTPPVQGGSRGQIAHRRVPPVEAKQLDDVNGVNGELKTDTSHLEPVDSVEPSTQSVSISEQVQPNDLTDPATRPPLEIEPISTLRKRTAGLSNTAILMDNVFVTKLPDRNREEQQDGP